MMASQWLVSSRTRRLANRRRKDSRHPSTNQADESKREMWATPGTESDLIRPLTERELGLLQFTTVLYYLHETNPDNGLVRDKTDPTAPASIAAIGMALSTIPVVV